MRRLTEKKGQAAIEFIAVIIVIFFFLFFYLSLAIVLTVSEYMDFATFMAARTYRSGTSSPEYQRAGAESVTFKQYTDKISPSIARNFRLEFKKLDPNDENTQGLVASYDMDLFYLPPIFVMKDQPVSSITLTSEAYLGRDPTAIECQNFFKTLTQKLGIDINERVDLMDDNGC